MTLPISRTQNYRNNPQVKEAQQLLMAKGYDVGRAGADGIFGKDSEAATKRFQSDKHLDVDGIIGPRTWAALTSDQQQPHETPGTISVSQVEYQQHNGGGDFHTWLSQACAAAGVPYNQAWKVGYETLCSRESSKDANAINKWDSNARGPIVADGYPQNCSRGIAQCIPSTFAAHHASGTSLSIYDPVANMAASIRYVLARYHVSANGADLARKVQQADPNRPPHGYFVAPQVQ